MKIPHTNPSDAKTIRWYVQADDVVLGPLDAESIARGIRAGDYESGHRISIDRVRWQRITAVFGRVFHMRAEDASSTPRARKQKPRNVHFDRDTSMNDREWEPVGSLVKGMFPPLLVTTTAGIIFAIVGMLMYSTVTGVAVHRESAVAKLVQPSIMTILGAGGQSKRHSAGFVVAHGQIVFPHVGRSVNGLKIETLDGDHMILADAVEGSCVDEASGLALPRAAIADETPILSPNKGQRPRIDDDLLLVRPVTSGRAGAERWTVVSLSSATDTASERFRIRRESGAIKPDDTIGCPVVDKRGRLVGIVVEAPTADLLDCVPVEVIRHIQHRLASEQTASGTAVGGATAGGKQDLGEPQGPSQSLPEAESPIIDPNPDDPNPDDPKPDDPKPDDPKPESPHSSNKPPQSDTLSAPEIAERFPTEAPRDRRDPLPPDPRTPANEERHPRTPDAQSDGAVISIPTPTAPDSIGDDLFIGLGKIARLPEAGLLPALSESDARRYGDEIRNRLLTEHAPCSDQATVRRITRLISTLIVAADERAERFTMTILQDEEVNACAFVGRNIVVNTGFLEFANGDTEMEQFVIAHEIGHIVLGHTDVAFRRAMLANHIIPGTSLGARALSMILSQTAYQQADEADADCFSVRCLKKIGVSQMGGVRFFERSRQRSNNPGQDTTLVDNLFRSHPSDSTRIRRILSGCE